MSNEGVLGKPATIKVEDSGTPVSERIRTINFGTDLDVSPVVDGKITVTSTAAAGALPDFIWSDNLSHILTDDLCPIIAG